MGSFFDDISERAEARRNLSWERQKSLIDSGIATPSLTNGSVDNSLTAEQAQAKTQLQDQKSRQAYSELMALPVGAVEGMLGIGGDVELLGQGIKGAYNADSGNRWEGFKEGLSDRDTMFWSTLDNQERTDQWLEGTEFGDRLKEGAGGRLVGEILAPLPPVAGVAKYGGKALNVLDDGITTANKFLDKNNIQAGLSIKDVSPKYTLQSGVKQTDTSLDFLKADEITQARQAQNRADLTKPLVNAQGTDNLGYKVRESDYAIGNSNDVVDSSLITRASNPNANRFDLADIGEGKFPKDQYIETKPDSFYDSLYKSQNKYGDLVEYDAKKTLERANSKNTDQRNIAEWENIFGKPTGSGKLGADKTVNPDLGLTYDGSEFPASLDPDAVKLTPNGRPTKAPQPEVDPFGDLTDEAFNIVIDANGNKIRQPKGNLNIKDMSYEDLQKSMSKDIEIQTPRGTVYRNLDDYTDSLDMGLDPATGKMQSPIYDAKNIDESVRNANKNDTHFTGDMADIGRKNIKDVELDTTINKVHDLVYDEVPTALNKADRVVDGQTIRPINDYLDGLDVKGTIAKGKLKTIQDLANNNFNSLDTKLNSLTRILDDVQTAVPKTTFNKKSQEAIIDAVHHAMFDAFEQAYKTNRIDAVAKKTIDTQLDKLITLKNADGTTSQSLKLVPRKGDSARVMKRSPNHRRQRIEKDRGSPDIERLPANDTPTQNRGLLDADDYETLQDTGSQGYNSGEGANTFKNTYTPASSTRRTKSKDAPKRSKRSKLNSKEEEELMPWLEDLPNYNFKGYR